MGGFVESGCGCDGGACGGAAGEAVDFEAVGDFGAGVGELSGDIEEGESWRVSEFGGWGFGAVEVGGDTLLEDDEWAGGVSGFGGA